MPSARRVINTVLRGVAAVDFSGHEPVESNREGWRQRMEHLKLEQVSPSNLSPGLRAVAVLEASKAVLILLRRFGLFALIHKNLDDIAEPLTETLRFIPQGSSQVPSSIWQPARRTRLFGCWQPLRWSMQLSGRSRHSV